jgi:hypothetical protein
MADATQELMLRVRGDNSGVDKAMAGTTRSVERLGVTAQKARGAFKSFSRDLSQARDASDIASSAASSLSMVLGRTLPGAIAVGAISVFTDQILKMKSAVDEAKERTKLATENIKKLGEAANLSDAIAQTSELDSNIKSLNAQLSKIEASPFQKLIAGMMGAKAEMASLVKTSQKLRDTKLAEGMASENANDELLSGLDAESKKLYEIDAQYRKRSKLAESITSPEESQRFKRDAGETMARQRNAILDKQAKDRAESQIKFDKMVFDAEQKLANQSEAREKQTEQERVQRKIDNNNRIYREERYNIDEKIKMESNADDRKFQRLVRDANRAREQQKRAQQTSADTGAGVLGASVAGRQALDLARKQRERQLKTENFKTAEKIAPTQRDREKLAAQVAAREMPSLGEQVQGGIAGIDPAQLAMQAAASKFEKDRMVGVPGRGMVGGVSPDAKLGQEQSTLSKETLQAIQTLVDLMKSGTVVK